MVIIDHIAKLISYFLRTGFCSVTFGWQLTEEQGPGHLHIPSREVSVKDWLAQGKEPTKQVSMKACLFNLPAQEIPFFLSCSDEAIPSTMKILLT